MVKSRRMNWGEHVVCIWEMRNAYKILVGRPGRKRPLGRPRHRWEDNIKRVDGFHIWKGEFLNR
jgi:hypothetical protein